MARPAFPALFSREDSEHFSSIENPAITADTLPAMRLIAQINDPDERGRVRTLLEDNGIPVFQQQGYRDPGAKATFVCIDSQYDDAIALLANPNHEVRDPVDVQEFHRRADTSGSPQLLKAALLVLLGVLLICGLLLALVW